MATANVQITWSDRTEKLADALFEEWKNFPADDPFSKICIVVHAAAAREWLKRYFLLDKQNGGILLNVRFALLPELLNDWLAAQTRGESPRMRRPAMHRYSPAVMTWRIYHELETNGDREEYRELREYIGGEMPVRRRYALARKLATLFDDYLNARPAMLSGWEHGQSRGDAPVWQKTLYRALCKEDPETYALEYEKALAANADPETALQYGFPRYRAIHVFDIPFIRLPELAVLTKIAETMPVHFWTFNPGLDWLAESKSKREAIRAICERHLRISRDEAEGDDGNTEEKFWREIYESPQARFLGALASGARALLCAQLNDSAWGGVSAEDVLGGDGFTRALDFSGVKKITMHGAFSPQRELEALRDGIEAFLVDHPDAGPRDVLVLCADWENYLPALGVVFPADETANGYIPVAVAGKTGEKDSLAGSLEKILAFRDNRFEVNAVADLLDVPAIRNRFDLTPRDVATLRDFILKANIHWGADDQDVADTLGEKELPETPYPFTWRRGLDRLMLDMLYGEPENPHLLVPAGNLGKINPCGEVEGERAEKLVAFWNFYRALQTLRRDFAANPVRSAAAWREMLFDVLDAFYAPQEGEKREMTFIRGAIRDLVSGMETAGIFAEKVDADVLIPALSEALARYETVSARKDDAVLFAPLNYSAAFPRKFVWICGLNDGVFPRVERMDSFDVVRRHPSLFDVDSREKDAYALLKGALSARETLAFSFCTGECGGDAEEKLPVILGDFADYFREIGRKFVCVTHRRFAYSRAYFDGTLEKVRMFSPENGRIAQLFYTNGKPENPRFSPFVFSETGDTGIDLDDVARFFASPNGFLLPEPYLNASALNDESAVDAADFNAKTMRKALLGKGIMPDENAIREFQEYAVASGMVPDEAALEKALEILRKTMEKLMKFQVDLDGASGETLKLYRRFVEEGQVSGESVTVDLPDGHRVCCSFTFRRLALQTVNGEETDHTFFFSASDKFYDSDLIRQGIRHLAACALGKKLFSVLFCFGKQVVFHPVETGAAQKTLTKLVEQIFLPLPGNCPDGDKSSWGCDEPCMPDRESFFELIQLKTAK